MGLKGLDGKVVLVTGGAGGLGTTVARRLSHEGARVVVVDLDPERAASTAESLPGEAIGVGSDASTEAGVAAYVEAALDRFQRIDGAHLAAGYVGALAPLAKTETADFDRVMAINARGTYLGLKALIPQLEEQGDGGSLVATSSGLGQKGGPNFGPYTAAKHAVLGLVRSTSLETARAGIRINAICPGMMDTQMMRPTERAIDPEDPERGRAALEGSVPLGRYARPEEVGSAVVWLLSEESSYVTGVAFDADGGVLASAGGFAA